MHVHNFKYNNITRHFHFITTHKFRWHIEIAQRIKAHDELAHLASMHVLRASIPLPLSLFFIFLFFNLIILIFKMLNNIIK
jgi:hypothetical protein